MLFPLPRGTAAGLQGALAGVEQKAPGPLPGHRGLLQRRHPRQCLSPPRPTATSSRWLSSRSCSPSPSDASPKRAAARVVDLFEAVGDALLVIIAWVLWIAPLGVFALAFTVGSAAGGSAFAGLGHYVVLISVIGILVTLAGYPLAILGGRIGPGAFSRGDDRAASGRDLHPLIARLAARDADRSARDGRSRAGGRRHLADRGRAVPGDGSGDERRGRVLRRALAWARASLGADDRRDRGRRGDELRRGQPARAKSASSARSLRSPWPSACRSRRLALLVAVEMIPDIFRTVGNVTLRRRADRGRSTGTREPPQS